MRKGRLVAGMGGGLFARVGQRFRRARKPEPIALGDVLRAPGARQGFSWSPTSGTRPTDGYMVATTGHTAQFPEHILDDPDAAAAAIDDYLMSHRGVFENAPDMHLGGWVEDGKLWLEPSRNIAGREEAVALARSTDQIAIYDVRTGDYIQTGGAGGFLEAGP
ncbi:hypothetical protein AB0395_01510 [Streptosporangium sp. NPDC051023]|uniref:hypothetical protein n=1 Tax=Streptosporangium sp. NPDC051023 TaxID=3155410 RepID=UPI00344CAF2C